MHLKPADLAWIATEWAAAGKKYAMQFYASMQIIMLDESVSAKQQRPLELAYTPAVRLAMQT